MKFTKFLLGIVFFLSIVIFDAKSQMGFTLPKIVIINGFLLGGFLFILLKNINLLKTFRWTDFKLRYQVNHRHQVKWNTRFKTTWIALAYFALLGFYVFFSLEPFTSFFGANPELQGFSTQILYLSAFVLAFMGTFDFFPGLLAANSLVILYGLLQIFGLDPSEAFLDRTYSTLGNPNFLASYIILTLPFLIGSWMRNASMRNTEKNAKKRFLFFLLVLGHLIVLISTASKGGILALAVVAISVFISERDFLKKHSKRLWITGFLIIFLIVFVFFTFQKRHALDFEASRSIHARQIIWTDSWKLIQSRPQGYGLETLYLFYPQVLNAKLFEYEKLTTNIDRAHNFILDLWIVAGPFAPLLIIIFLMFIVKSSWKQRETRMIALGLVGYYITLFFSFETVMTGFMFWLIAGWLLNCVGSIKEPLKNYCAVSLLYHGIVVGLIFALTWSFQLNIRHFIADQSYSKAEKLLTDKGANKDNEKALKYYEKAVRIYPYDQVYVLKATEVALFTLEKMKNEGARKEISEFIEKNFTALEKLTRDYDASTHLLKAWFFALSEKPKNEQDTNTQKKKVEEFIEIGKKLSPNHVNTYKMAAHIYGLLGEKEKEKSAYQSLFSLLPSYLNNPAGDATRIFWKENIWLRSLPYDTMQNRVTAQ